MNHPTPITTIPIAPSVTLTVADDFAADHAERFAGVFADAWSIIPAADRAVVLADAGKRGVTTELAIFTNPGRFDIAHADGGAHCLRFSTFAMHHLPDELVALIFAHEAAHLLDFAGQPHDPATAATLDGYWRNKTDRESAAIETAEERWGFRPLWQSTWSNRELAAAIDRALPPPPTEIWLTTTLANGDTVAAPVIEPPSKLLPPLPQHAAITRWCGLHPRCGEYWRNTHEQWSGAQVAAAVA